MRKSYIIEMIILKNNNPWYTINQNKYIQAFLDLIRIIEKQKKSHSSFSPGDRPKINRHTRTIPCKPIIIIVELLKTHETWVSFLFFGRNRPSDTKYEILEMKTIFQGGQRMAYFAFFFSNMPQVLSIRISYVRF